jgi:PBP1b-binding outer membrane lipoprotein LpoB
MNPLPTKHARVAVLACAIFVAAGCVSEPPAPISREEKMELTATVEAIDHQTRMVSLRSPEGRKATVYASPEVHNFDQIKVGDVVAVSFYAAIGAEVTTPDKATQGVQHDSATIRAAKGERPGAAVAQTVTTTVEIDSVDTSMNTVTFRRDDGLVRVLPIEDPKAQAFIKELKRGDLVQVTYMEAVAVSVRPVDRTGS